MRGLFVLLLLYAYVGVLEGVGFSPLATVPTIRNQQYRDIRLTSSDPITGIYEGCIADSVGIVEITQITINASSGSAEVTPKNTSNYNLDGSTYNSATVTQESSSPCTISGIVTFGGIQNILAFANEEIVCKGPDVAYTLPNYSIMTSRGIMTTHLFRSTTGVKSVFNCSDPGPLSYIIDNDNFIIPKYGITYATLDLHWVYVQIEEFNNYIVFECTLTACNQTHTIQNSGDFSLVTSSGDMWYGCGKSGTDWFCTSSLLNGEKVLLSNISAIAPPVMSQYSLCQPTDDTLLLIIVTEYYVIYALDTRNDFAIINQSEPRAIVTGGFTGAHCRGEIIVLGITNELHVYKYQPPVVVAPVTAPSDTPTATPLVDTPSGTTPVPEPVSPPKENNVGSGGLTEQDRNTLIGVLIGVGLPLIGAAVFLAVFYSKKNQKKKSAANDTYSMMPAKPDEIIDEKLKIPYKALNFVKEIGAGSFGKVFLGKWHGAVVAIKTNNKTADNDAFLAEARLTLKMPPHPNVVLTYGVSIDTDVPCIVLEFCDGGSLDRIVYKQTLGTAEQRALVKGIALGLAHLHTHNIVHRDLAARNVLLDKGVPKISDFGMSRVLKDAAQLGQTNSNIGPVRWMAPESIKDMSYSVKSDVWTFGIVISEIVLQNEPHFGENQIEVACNIRDNGFTPRLPSECDPLLKELTAMCWKVDPAERPTMEQICEYISDKF